MQPTLAPVTSKPTAMPTKLPTSMPTPSPVVNVNTPQPTEHDCSKFYIALIIHIP
jgi:hypothetical protein